jgi:hypothetical protein
LDSGTGKGMVLMGKSWWLLFNGGFYEHFALPAIQMDASINQVLCQCPWLNVAILSPLPHQNNDVVLSKITSLFGDKIGDKENPSTKW